jgi:hypothetical protein
VCESGLDSFNSRVWWRDFVNTVWIEPSAFLKRLEMSYQLDDCHLLEASAQLKLVVIFQLLKRLRNAAVQTEDSAILSDSADNSGSFPSSLQTNW